MADANSLWRAMAHPHRFLLSWWPWRTLGYVVSTVLVGVALVVALPVTLLFPPVLLFLGLPVGALERRRLRLVYRDRLPTPHGVPPPGLFSWLRFRLGSAATWRELSYTVSLASVLLVISVLGLAVLFACLLFYAAPYFVATEGMFRVGGVLVTTERAAWVVTVAVAPLVTVIGVYLLAALAGAQASFARWLLAPSDAELDRRVQELAHSRARLVNAFEAERRRIERDLHDGAQQHLVLLSMTLGLARLELDGQSRAGELVSDAQNQARQALAAVRELIHGIHPQVLTDLGLAAAVSELAERCPVPVRVDIRLSRRLPVAVESTAYFVVSEALTNTVRHARATEVMVTGRLEARRLWVTVTDDGTGGADPSRGSGLRGLADRSAVMDGTLSITSPSGGPTTIRLELPCRFE